MKVSDSELVERLDELPSKNHYQTALALVRLYLRTIHYIQDHENDKSSIQLQEKVEPLQEKVKRRLEEVKDEIPKDLPPNQLYVDWLRTLWQDNPDKIPGKGLHPVKVYTDWLRTLWQDKFRSPEKELPPVQLYIDWLRTLWQKIHYRARQGTSEPRGDWIKELADTYEEVYLLTVWVLQTYLSAHESEQGLIVDSDWLLAWLVSNALLSPRLAGHYGLEGAKNNQKSIASPVEKMNYFVHLSHLVLYVLYCARHLHRRKKLQEEDELQEESSRLRHLDIQQFTFADVPEDFSLGLSESQLYILSEYAYREIGVHRELVLFERLARQLRYELPLYAASERYRDHLFHVVDVCLLGELLLRSLISSRYPGASRNLLDVFCSGTDCKDSRLLMQNWYVAALCHDLGYVVERVGNLLKPVHTINGPGLDEFWKAVKDGLKYGDTEIKKTTKSKLSSLSNLSVTKDDLEKVAATDHGVAAWLHLQHWLDQVKESPQKLTPALNAILRHNLPEPRVSCSREPLTLLLMLCDHLQEWGRPRVGPDPLSRGVMEALRFSTQVEFERKVQVKRLLIEGLKIMPASQSDPIQTQIKQSGGLKFKLCHVESREGDFEPAISWLLLCHNLQCFGNQSKELPFDIEIILEHTPSRIWYVMPWKPLEMDLVQEFASEYEPATYLCDWVEKARRGEDGICYRECKGFETFTIHLNKLGRPLPRGLPDKHWEEFFQWKWRRLGQQFIDVSLGDLFPER